MTVPIEDHELLAASRCGAGGAPDSLNLYELHSGAIGLFRWGFFPWGGLPYPFEHARLGILLMGLGQLERAQRMAAWQRQMVDQRGRPIVALFNQEGSVSSASLEETVVEFLSHFPELPLAEYVDEELGIVRRLNEKSTFLAVGSGCKSGMGAYLSGEGGIINYGPQLSPLGDCSAFGLAGRPLRFEYDGARLRYQTRLAAPHPRKSVFPLEDSGYSGLWMAVEQSAEETRCSVKGTRASDGLSFSFFMKSSALRVATSHRLMTRSLDRYTGPPAPVTLESGLTLSVIGGPTQMEVIPLAGDESFWGSDFLVMFSKSPTATINWTISTI